MKKVLMAIICIMMIATSVMAQSKRNPQPQYSNTQTSISIRPIVGYGFGAGKGMSYVGLGFLGGVGNDFEIDKDTNVTKDQNIYYSAGEGIKMGVAVDYELLEGIAAGLEIGYSMGMEKEVGKSKDYTGTTLDEENTKAKTSYLFCNPTLRVSKSMMIRGLGRVIPFCVFGPTLAIAPKTTTKHIDKGTLDVEKEGEISYGMGMGAFGVLGIEYPIMKNISIFGQLKIDQLSLKASKMKLTKWTIDDDDQLADMVTYQKEVEFKDDCSGDNSAYYDNDPDTTKPCVVSTYITPANSFGINVGVAVNF